MRPQRRTVVSLLDAYGVTGDKRAELLELLKQSAQLGWLNKFESELPELYLHYVSFEAEARSIRNYESLFIPGLLQTEDYARAAITQAGLPIPNPDDIDHRVEVRMQRQTALTRKDPFQLWAIVDEAVLHRAVVGDDVMTAQLSHLLDASKAANVVIQVIPFAAGAHAGMPGSFVIMDFPESQDPDLVYSDSMAGDVFLESEADGRRFTAVFDLLRASALSPTDSTRMIAERIKALKKGRTP